jgi:hypothetical protein
VLVCRDVRGKVQRHVDAEQSTMKFGISYHAAHHGVDPDRILAAMSAGSLNHWRSLRFRACGGHPPDPARDRSAVAAYHHPVVLARRLATVDVLSRGRMRLLTVGLGALPGEARAVGVDFASRGRGADEAIDVLRLLWAGGADGVSFRGEFFAFDDLCSFPNPRGVTHLPVHLGGVEPGGRPPRRATRRRVLSGRRTDPGRAGGPA